MPATMILIVSPASAPAATASRTPPTASRHAKLLVTSRFIRGLQNAAQGGRAVAANDLTVGGPRGLWASPSTPGLPDEGVFPRPHRKLIESGGHLTCTAPSRFSKETTVKTAAPLDRLPRDAQ